MRRIAVVACIACLAMGCGGDGATTAGPSGVDSSTGGAGATTTAGGTGATSGGGGAEVAPMPPLPDPAPALPCDGTTVLCVDGAVGASAPDGSAQQPFPSVSDALAAAGSGVVIQVAAGVYEEALILADVQGLSLVGGFPANGGFSDRDPTTNETVLQGGRDAAVIDITGSSGVHIEGFRITGGGGKYDGYNYAGGGINIDQTVTDVSIVANRIDGNAVDQGDDPYYALGGGIASNATSLTVVGNVIEGNRAGRGGAIAAFGEVSVERNTIRNNVGVGDHGSGLYLAGEVTVVGNRVEGNRLESDYGWGGGILVFGDDTAATLRGNVVTANSAPSAGSGVFVDDGADATLIGELYYANQCAYDGGAGLFVDSGGQTVTVVEAINVTIANHDCPEAALGGNAILAEISDPAAEPTEVTVSNSIFWGNAGRDILSAGASIVVTFSLLEEPIEGEGNLSADPLFVDPASGDFHVGTGSPAIDAGDPAAAYDAEPEPNGERINLGHTGNTPEAALS
jgi:hypothetical protein